MNSSAETCPRVPSRAQRAVIAVAILLALAGASAGATGAETGGAPVDLSRPQIAGVLQQGQTLTASTGAWQNATRFGYGWLRCDAAGGGCAPIAGATAATYTLSAADVGSSIRVRVSAFDDAGSASADSVDDALGFDGSSAYVETADSATLRPEDADGFTAAFWVKLDSYDNNVLPRFWEKGSSYMAVMGDPTNAMYRRVAIEAQNASGSGNANGGASEYWGSTVLTTGVWYHIVGVFDGASGQGQIYVDGVPETMRTIFPWTGRLQSSAGKDLFLARRGGDGTRSLQGQLDSFVYYARALSPAEIAQLNAGVPPAGAAAAYGFDEDSGTTVADGSGSGNPGTVVAAAYSRVAGRAATVAPAAPVDTAAPRLSGTALEGVTLSVSTGTWEAAAAPSFGYRWLRCDGAGASCAPIAGASSAAYRAASADVGSTLRAVVTATLGGFSASAETDASAPVAAGAPVNTVLPSIAGVAEPGRTLSGDEGSWTSSVPATFADRWRRCDAGGANCVDAGVNGPSYPVGVADRGHTLVFEVTATTSGGSTTMASAPSGDFALVFPDCPATCTTAASVSTADDVSLRPDDANRAFSLAFWIKVSPNAYTNVGAGTMRLWEKGSHFFGIDTSGSTSNCAGSTTRRNCLQLELDDSTTPTALVRDFFGSTPITTGVWHHVVVTVDASATNAAPSVRMYLDGNAETVRVAGGSTWLGPLRSTASAGVVLGARAGSTTRNFQGMLDSFGFYQSALSAADVGALYRGDAVPAGATLVYDFDDASGTLVADASGGNHAGTRTAAVASVVSDR